MVISILAVSLFCLFWFSIWGHTSQGSLTILCSAKKNTVAWIECGAPECKVYAPAFWVSVTGILGYDFDINHLHYI